MSWPDCDQIHNVIFDHHHAANDTFDAVNKRELELGAATMTSLVYLIDKYGFNTVETTPKLKD